MGLFKTDSGSAYCIKENVMFETVIYNVIALDGDYAVMVSEAGVENRVARALLPPETDVGCTVKWENLSYEII